MTMVRCKIVGFGTLTFEGQTYKAGDVADLPEDIVKQWGLPVLPAEDPAPAPAPEPKPKFKPGK